MIDYVSLICLVALFIAYTCLNYANIICMSDSDDIMSDSDSVEEKITSKINYSNLKIDKVEKLTATDMDGNILFKLDNIIDMDIK